MFVFHIVNDVARFNVQVIVAATFEELSLSDLTPQVASLVLSSGSRVDKETLVEKVMESFKGLWCSS